MSHHDPSDPKQALAQVSAELDEALTRLSSGAAAMLTNYLRVTAHGPQAPNPATKAALTDALSALAMAMAEIEDAARQSRRAQACVLARTAPPRDAHRADERPDPP